jgi:tetrahydromethanopterin S-methyltransferase subunit C
VGLVVTGALLFLYRAGWKVVYRTRPALHRTSTRWYNHAGLGLFGLAMILAGLGASTAAGAMVVAAGLTGLLAIIRAVATG